MIGRRPNPTELLRGNPGHRPTNSNEPSSPVLQKMPPAPDILDDEGKRFWRKRGKELIAAKLLTVLDLDLFASLCILVVQRNRVARELKDAKPLSIGAKGGSYMNPLMSEILGLTSAMRQIEVEFGKSPASRSKVKVINPRQEDLFDILDGPGDVQEHRSELN